MARKCCKSNPPCKNCPKLKKRKKTARGACQKIGDGAHPLAWADKAG